MDSEGIGGLEKDNNYDVKLMTLAMLLSSVLIYNSVGKARKKKLYFIKIGAIDEPALENLSLIVNLAKNI